MLPFSSLTFAGFAPSQKLESFIRSHEKMWAYFGGVTPYLVVDNLKSGVKQAHIYDPEVNPTYCDYANQTGFAVLPARPKKPRDKAAVEAAIGVIQRSFYQQHRETKFYSLAEANTALRAFIDQLNHEVMKDYGISRRDRFANEKQLLEPAPEYIYEMTDWRKAKVHPDCCIQSGKAFYSVPFKYIGQSVRVKIMTKNVEIFDSGLNSIACHHRQPAHGTSALEEHLPPSQMQPSSFEVKQMKAKANAIGPNTSKLIHQMLSGDRPLRYLRRTQGIIRIYENGLSREALEYAAAQAITFGRRRLDYIKSCAKHFSELGSRPQRSATPIRISSTIHLHGDP